MEKQCVPDSPRDPFRRGDNLPVVLVTAYPHDVPALAATEHGRQPDAVLAKPVPADLLLSTAAALVPKAA